MRVLSFHPIATEIVFALGAGPLLVGRTESCTYPEAAARVPSLGKQGEIGLETVGILEPDVILLGPGQVYGGAMKTMRIEPKSISELYTIIKELGSELGKQVEADMLIHEIQSTLERVQLRCAKFHTVKAYVDGAPEYVAELVRIAGGEPTAGEGVVEFDPQYLIALSDARAEEMRKTFSALRAVQSERVYVIPEESFRPTPRLLLGAKQLAKILHGVDVNGS